MRLLSLLLVSVFLHMPMQAFASTLDSIVSEGALKCGVSTGQKGFSQPDSRGNWYGLDVDICKALAVAMFGGHKYFDVLDKNIDEDKISETIFVPLLPSERIAALKNNEVDILLAKMPVSTFSQFTLDLEFPIITYYNGQGFLVRKSTGINNAWHIKENSTVCMLNKSIKQRRALNFFNDLKINVQKVIVNDIAGMTKAYNNGHCDIITDYVTTLAEMRLSLINPDSAYILPQLISRRPLGPAITNEDPALRKVVQIVVSAIIEADGLGITSTNIDHIKENGNDLQKKFLSVGNDERYKLDDYLADDWVEHVIRQVGNYSEIFERNLGRGSPLNLEQGINRTWFLGGIQFVPPVAFYEENEVDPLIDLDDFQFLFDDVVNIQKLLSPTENLRSANE